jgi:N-acetylmuramoyl-L-alanine amidase
MDNNGNEKFQDIWSKDNKDSVWTAFWAGHLTERSNYANNSTSLFISLHADLLLDSNWNINDKDKILSIKYDERQAKWNTSKKIGEGIMKNGFWYYFNGTLASDVKRDVKSQKLWVLKPTISPAILVEFWNISQENQAYTLRQSDKREELAKSLVSSLIATL